MCQVPHVDPLRSNEQLVLVRLRSIFRVLCFWNQTCCSSPHTGSFRIDLGLRHALVVASEPRAAAHGRTCRIRPEHASPEFAKNFLGIMFLAPGEAWPEDNSKNFRLLAKSPESDSFLKVAEMLQLLVLKLFDAESGTPVCYMNSQSFRVGPSYPR